MCTDDMDCFECPSLQICLSDKVLKRLENLREYKLQILRNNLRLIPIPELKDMSKEIHRLDFSIKNFKELSK